MQEPPPGKRARQRLIASIVTRRRIATQHELRAALAATGCHVTQATISRDIRELGLEKVHDPLGRPRYEVPARGRRRQTPQEVLESVLAQFGRSATAAQNLVVLQAETGSAPAIARALDRVEHARVLGTVAGDDTVLVVTRSQREARALAAELSQSLAVG
jgi:transcriptional regulator of arginine metabolism